MRIVKFQMQLHVPDAVEVKTLRLAAANDSSSRQFSQRGCDDRPLAMATVIIAVEHNPVIRRSHFVSMCGIGKQGCVVALATMCVQNRQPRFPSGFIRFGASHVQPRSTGRSGKRSIHRMASAQRDANIPPRRPPNTANHAYHPL